MDEKRIGAYTRVSTGMQSSESQLSEIKNYLKALTDLAKLQHLHKEDKSKEKEKKEEKPFTKAEEKAIKDRTASVLGESWTESSVKH